MKKIKLTVLALTLSLSGFSQMNDGTKHKIAGTVITLGVSEIVFQTTQRKGLALVSGFVAGVGAGLVKEYVWDKSGKGTVNGWDAVDTGWGSAVGSIIFAVRIDIHNNRSNRKEIIKTF